MGDRAEVKIYITNESPKPVKEYQTTLHRTVKASKFFRSEIIHKEKKEAKCEFGTKHQSENKGFYFDLPISDFNHWKKPELRYPDEDR